MTYHSCRGLRWLLGSGLAVVLSLNATRPALAHGLLDDGDGDFLLANTLLAFSLPLLILVVGVELGVGLSWWFDRRRSHDSGALARPHQPDGESDSRGP